MAHNVKCKFCEEIFNRDIVQAVKVGGRRYAHLRCVPEEDRDKYELMPLAESKDEDLVQLEEHIMKGMTRALMTGASIQHSIQILWMD